MVENTTNPNFHDYDKSVFETVPVETAQKDAVITDTEVAEHRTLIMSVSFVYFQEIKGDIFQNKTVKINAKGILEGGLRKKQDGLCYFGFDETNSDFLLFKNKENKCTENPIFLIYYRRDNGIYYIKPLCKNENNSLFMDLTKPVVRRFLFQTIQNSSVISVQNYNLKLSLTEKNNLLINYEIEGGKVEDM